MHTSLLPMPDRIRKGIEELDAFHVDPRTWIVEPWWDDHRIDLDVLDLSNGCMCVLGQLANPKLRGTTRIYTDHDVWRQADGVQCGFIRFGGSEYPYLTVAWVEAIEARRATVAAGTVISWYPQEGT